MTESPFDLLGLPPRPAIDPDALKDAYRRLAAVQHPDSPGSEAGRMAALNAARRILEDVPARLRLLASACPSAAEPPPRSEPDWSFAQELQRACTASAEWIAQFSATPSALQKALLLAKLPPLRAEHTRLAVALDARAGDLEARLTDLDARWPAVFREELETLAGEWTFWKRQHDHLAEARLSLDVAAPV